jgi:hypothetical protein
MLGYTSDNLDKWFMSLESVINRPGTDKEDITNLVELADFLVGLESEGRI